MFLTSQPADRAYTGRTGTKTDAWLSDKLGVRGLLGRARRNGMADLFHCFDGCARKVWEGGNKKEKDKREKEARRLEQDSETEESIVGEDADLAPDRGDALPLVVWARVCRRLRAILGRGQGNYHLQKAPRHSMAFMVGRKSASAEVPE